MREISSRDTPKDYRGARAANEEAACSNGRAAQKHREADSAEATNEG
jgi:hypothetical protein